MSNNPKLTVEFDRETKTARVVGTRIVLSGVEVTFTRGVTERACDGDGWAVREPTGDFSILISGRMP